MENTITCNENGNTNELKTEVIRDIYRNLAPAYKFRHCRTITK